MQSQNHPYTNLKRFRFKDFIISLNKLQIADKSEHFINVSLNGLNETESSECAQDIYNLIKEKTSQAVTAN